jgi:hypothetical protein
MKLTIMADANQHGWAPRWVLPNITVDNAIETSVAAVVNCRDQRVQAFGRRYPAFIAFLNSFRTEFNSRLCPSVMLLREDAPTATQTIEALGGFRDAICISALVISHAHYLKSKRGAGIRFSDSFDVYPWFLGRDYDHRVYAFTPAVTALHRVDRLRAQCAPALGERSLSAVYLDETLLRAIFGRWQTRFGEGSDCIQDRRLFRALDMARAASRMPGGADATIYDDGRALSLWVSAFEILAHDGQSDLRRVIELLNRFPAEQPNLRALRRPVEYRKSQTIMTNAAGEIYAKIYRARCAFLHGNPVEAKTLVFGDSDRHLLHFAAPLFRFALTSHLDLKFPGEMPNAHEDAKAFGRYVTDRMDFMVPQRLMEAAISTVDQPLAHADLT